jgi:hypothetical protein
LQSPVLAARLLSPPTGRSARQVSRLALACCFGGRGFKIDKREVAPRCWAAYGLTLSAARGRRAGVYAQKQSSPVRHKNSSTEGRTMMRRSGRWGAQRQCARRESNPGHKHGRLV